MNEFDDDELSPATWIAGIALIIFFIFFFFSATPDLPKQVYVPAHWETVKPKMND